ncbi:hypothetical protein MNV_1050003 [Candidatus Methanoperedens nitroreducens]|uniref:Uncharacterized protein n=1 Tax=Candidatus Methanoperedens nitratireducens TaxID=1392998 RepID=A0A284VIE8_9EURY|nr:hypothetical protein MNV_1050003 [Candidatus Methanoperedens nitroreducens]
MPPHVDSNFSQIFGSSNLPIAICSKLDIFKVGQALQISLNLSIVFWYTTQFRTLSNIISEITLNQDFQQIRDGLDGKWEKRDDRTGTALTCTGVRHNLLNLYPT